MRHIYTMPLSMKNVAIGLYYMQQRRERMRKHAHQSHGWENQQNWNQEEQKQGWKIGIGFIFRKI